MKLLLLLVIFSIGLLALLEGALRRGWGFGQPLLYRADDQIGYLLAPNQQVRRFGQRIEINAYSMRSAPITAQPSAQTWRLLLLGDSVANGGWWTDQSQTISEILRLQLISGSTTACSATDPALANPVQSNPTQSNPTQSNPAQSSPTQSNPTQSNSHPATSSAANPGPSQRLRPPTASTIEVLNASANSWGPRNELAYLQRFGSFDAQVIVLLINTDDLFATAPSSLVVGQDRNYPDRLPASAIHEVLQRYLLPAPPQPAGLRALATEPGDRVGINLAAIGMIAEFSQQHQAQLLVLLTPLLREIGSPGSRAYEVAARQRLQDFTQAASLDYIDCLPIFNQDQEPAKLYRDHIHLSPIGNQRLSDLIFKWVAKIPPGR
jgi:GDSL-like Lipase/Acylhydrolase family